MTVKTPFRQAFDPIPGHAGRFAQLLRELTPAEQAAPVPAMAWTAADVGRHVLTVLHRYGTNPQLASTRAGLTELNEHELRALELSMDEVADGIEAAVASLAALAPHIPLDHKVDFHLGYRVELAAAWANLCSELLVHGTDIARATGREWRFPEADIEGMWRNLLPVTSGWLRPEALTIDETYELRFRFGTVTVRLHRGEVTVGDRWTRTLDHVTDIDDGVAFTLGVPWRRTLLTDPVGALLLSRLHEI